MSKIYKSINFNNEKKLITHSIDDLFEISENIENNVNIINIDDDNSENDMEKRKLIMEAKQEAEKIIRQAKKQADEIIEKEKNNINKWWDDKRAEDLNIIEEVKKDGYKDGYSEGKIIAEDDMKQQYQSKIEQAQKILEESYKIKEQIIQEAELPIIETSIEIAEKIIKKEMETDKNIIKLIAKEALKNVNEFEKISIYINPEYFSYVHSAREDLLRELNGQVELMIYPDPSINDGGCIIRTSTGTLDAKIDTQLEEIKQALYDIAGRTEG